MTQPIVGVIGGMGPEATVELMLRVIRATPAKDDADHIRMIVDNNPKIPPRVAAILNGGESPIEALVGMAKSLETSGANFLVMPCNSAHYFLPDIRKAVSIPVLDMIGLTLERLRLSAQQAQSIGILCTAATRRTGLFTAGCSAADVAPLFCDEKSEALLFEVIRAVKAGCLDESVREDYRRCAAHLIDAGADAVIVACTELSTLGGLESLKVPVIDTMDTLVKEIVSRCIAPADFSHH